MQNRGAECPEDNVRPPEFSPGTPIFAAGQPESLHPRLALYTA